MNKGMLIGLACLALGSLLGTLHMCLVNLSATELEELAEKRGGKRALRRVERILEDIDGHARALALARIACNLAVAISAVWMVARLRGVEAPGLVDGAVGLGVSVLALWFFGVTLAESIASHASERFALAFTPLVRALYLIELPLSPVARVIDTMVRKIAGNPIVDSRTEAADELLSVVEDVEREGAIDEGERRMIEAVVNFKSRTVEQIMTPRTEIEAVELTSNLGKVTAFVRKARHSRVPVYKTGGTLDDIIGFFYVKDLLRWLAGDVPAGVKTGGGGGFDLTHIIRPAMFVPATKTVRALAEEFVQKKVHIAVVADEYGGVAGLVSLEDIIEEVFGEIQDEYEKSEDEPPKIEVTLHPAPNAGQSESLGMADADARAYIPDVNEALEPLGITIPEDDQYDTLGGFVLTQLGRIPEVNESFVYGRAQLSVLEASPTRVIKVRIQLRTPSSEISVKMENPVSSTDRPG